ncbi:UNVERIFIED_CONTAM: Heat shock protein 90-6, mitochondrial [Sesamum radiatum]|uniref:Heat shock protein 90-6, mitochondrial n=1 Tax=Sesamum radiatum TaxID=300843 RepID=A0AAW2U1T2_SESRA
MLWQLDNYENHKCQSDERKVEVDEDPPEASKGGQDVKTELRNPKEVTTEEDNELYKKTFNEYLEPLASSHFTIEVPLITKFSFEVSFLLRKLQIEDINALESHNYENHKCQRDE